MGVRNACSDFRRHFNRSRRCRVSQPDLVFACCSSGGQGSDIFRKICARAQAPNPRARRHSHDGGVTRVKSSSGSLCYRGRLRASIDDSDSQRAVRSPPQRFEKTSPHHRFGRINNPQRPDARRSPDKHTSGLAKTRRVEGRQFDRIVDSQTSWQKAARQRAHDGAAFGTPLICGEETVHPNWPTPEQRLRRL